MLTTTAPIALIALGLIAGEPDAAEEAAPGVEPVKEVQVDPTDAAFDDSSATQPIEITSLEDAEPYFEKAALATLEAGVDFEKQTVLLFAWRGSGQDKLAVMAGEAEDGVEQVVFTYTAGMTRDLRPHTAVYAVRSGVAWRVERGAAGIRIPKRPAG